MRRLRFVAVLVLLAAFYAASWHLAKIEPARLLTGLPKMAGWATKAWPPATDELPILLQRTAETIAMAAIGTTAAALLALPMCVFAARNVTPSMALYYPARWFLNGLRGVDSFVFALLFVAAVGLGPFAGVLGIALHTWGSTAKLWAEAIENIPPGPLEAVLRCRVSIALGEARIRTGDTAGRELCIEAARIARELGDAELLARAGLAYGAVFTMGMVDRVLVDMLADALARLPAGDSAVRASVSIKRAGMECRRSASHSLPCGSAWLPDRARSGAEA